MAPIRKPIIKEEVRKQFPLEDIRGYAIKGVRGLANKLLEVAETHDENRRAEIVLPSRGAISPTVHALLYMFAASEASNRKIRQRYRDALDKIYVPPFLSGIMEMVLGTRSRRVVRTLSNRDAPVRFIILPFTADVNMDKMLDHIQKHGEEKYRSELGITREHVPDNDQVKVEIRSGGVRILKELLKPPEERKPLFRIFTNLIEAEGRKDMAERYRRYYIEPGSDIYLIDTVISGTAATHIKDALDKEGLRVKPILLIDKNGSKLHADKRRILNTWAAREDGTLIYTPRLPAEDKGVGFLGTAAVVYPQIGVYLRRIGDKDFYPTLFGTWIPVHQVHRVFQDAFEKYTRVVMLSFLNDPDKQSKSYIEFLKVLSKNRELLSHGIAVPEELGRQLGSLSKKGTLLYHKDIDDVYETPARVAHVYYEPRKARKYIGRILR